MPHVPQLLESFIVSVHVPPQSASGAQGPASPPASTLESSASPASGTPPSKPGPGPSPVIHCRRHATLLSTSGSARAGMRSPQAGMSSTSLWIKKLPSGSPGRTITSP